MGTISKALGLLDLFSSDKAEIGLSDFVRLSKRDKATVHRYLTELAENGFLEQNTESRAYRLGPAVLRLSALRESLFPVRKLLQPLVIELSETVGELTHASLLQHEEMSPLVHADPRMHGIQVHFDIAEMLPLHATSSGMAVLAFCPDATIRKLVAGPLKKHTEATVSEPSQLLDLIESIRKYGLCTLTNAFEDGVSSVGAPLFGQGPYAIGALAVAVPTTRATPSGMREIAESVSRYARQASIALGATIPRNFESLPPDWGNADITKQF